MRFFQTKVFFILFVSLVMFSACGMLISNSNQKTNTNNAANTNANADTTKDDIEDFAKVVKLPFQPEEVSWRETSDKKLIAVIKFSAADAQTLITNIEKQKPIAPAEINAENWFPPELVAKSQQSGDELLKGKVYSANDFFLAPYNNGKITRIDDTNYFILELSVG